VTTPDTSTNEPATRRARFIVAYNGAPFHGFAINEGVETVGGLLQDAISTVARCDAEIVVAGRTDKGVHARAQVVSCDLPEDADLERIHIGVNALCGPHISVREISWVADDFHARFSAKWRHYKYFVLNTPTPDPMLIDRTWHVRDPLSLPMMQLACDGVLGENDFTSFCKKPAEIAGQPPASMKRYVMKADWHDMGDGQLVFDIRANAFCHQMVRSIVGFMIEVGMHRRKPAETRQVLLAKDRTLAPNLAPPQGLFLWEVGY
jgi:tRNA pseudouridine38-40 synthase